MARFWAMTPRELGLFLEAQRRRLIRQFDADARVAWLTAKLTAYAPEKGTRFVKLERLLHHEKKVEKMDWRQQAAILDSW
ncbi:hypothetical protein [Devosia sp.]|uniref:hypothetical protein n=1 Tax=Devosia sp. TaxID=1871048 RepID=UPI001B2D5D5D|nr:hypothetical protein [Devosia sp.]MBO9589064.1 hypothetical protein [Devosia sp.]